MNKKRFVSFYKTRQLSFDCYDCFQVLKEVYLSESVFIVLDCGKETLGEVLKQAQQVFVYDQ
jgi:hypothetical protein